LKQQYTPPPWKVDLTVRVFGVAAVLAFILLAARDIFSFPLLLVAIVVAGYVQFHKARKRELHNPPRRYPFRGIAIGLALSIPLLAVWERRLIGAPIVGLGLWLSVVVGRERLILRIAGILVTVLGTAQLLLPMGIWPTGLAAIVALLSWVLQAGKDVVEVAEEDGNRISKYVRRRVEKLKTSPPPPEVLHKLWDQEANRQRVRSRRSRRRR
jgi:hypothetical protein